MKYDLNQFNKGVDYYKKKLGNVKGKVIFIEANVENKIAFFSIAPLSRAVHEIGGDIHVAFNGESKVNLTVLKEVWSVYKDYKKGIKNEKISSMLSFIDAVQKKAKNKDFEKIFHGPEIILAAGKSGFIGTLDLDYQPDWFKPYREKEIFQTAKRIWSQGYGLQKNEKASIGFVLVPPKNKTELPFEDYLDSFAIAYGMKESAKSMGAEASMASSTDRFSMVDEAVRTVELITTLRGCEYDKEVKEEAFIKFKNFSKQMNIKRLTNTSASFGIHAKGYYGKHFFGDKIGYPTLDKKTRWSSPGQMMLKDPFSPQTAMEKRPPLMRYAITETLPIDEFITTCDIDYDKIRKRSETIRDIMNKCQYVRVVGADMHGYKTDLKIDLVAKNGKRREFTAQDSDVRHIIDPKHYKKTGIKAGMFANFPSGETFVTPEKVAGTMVGDVVINLDRSYRLSKKNPLVIDFNGTYKIRKAEHKILKTIKKELNDAKKKIREYEKNKSLPSEIIKIYKDNFNSVGEFAVNTNPKAKLSNYLIVNEKIANMIHIALGSGFEPDKKSVYHWDIVLDSPRQKLDIYAVDNKGAKHWVHKKGKLVV